MNSIAAQKAADMLSALSRVKRAGDERKLSAPNIPLINDNIISDTRMLKLD